MTEKREYIQKNVVAEDSGTVLRRVRCVIKQGGRTILDKDLEKKGNVFAAEVREVREGSGYSVWMYGYSTSAYCFVSSFQGGISVEKGKITDVCLTWHPFEPELCRPALDAVVDSSSVTFAWRTVPCAQSYYLEVDNNDNFTSPSLSRSVADTSYTWNTENYKGTFYWRVTCRYDRGFGDKSNTGSFSIHYSG